MKIRKDVLATLATLGGALFALFFAMPTWLLSATITLTVVVAALAVMTIVNMRKASLDATTGKYTYKFPVRVFVMGALALLAIFAIILLCLKAMFGLALIPVTVLIAILFVIAIRRVMRRLFWATLLALVLITVFAMSYGSATLVAEGVSLNPGIETTVPETTAPETDAPETTVPENTTPEINVTPVIKIDAPKAMSYAEPITIKLEGIKAQNLKFSNEDFLAIAIISDSEVEVTLIGIVNDAGEVEFLPASGYITVTDAASGIHSVIKITE